MLIRFQGACDKSVTAVKHDVAGGDIAEVPGNVRIDLVADGQISDGGVLGSWTEVNGLNPHFEKTVPAKPPIVRVSFFQRTAKE